MPDVIEWRPHAGAQEHFHENGAYECLFGGSKGPGKTECLLREALRQVENPNYRAIIFRRTYPRLGEIIDRSHKYYSKMGAVFSSKDSQVNLPAWTFASGAKICFAHVQHEKDKWNYHGKEFHFIGFDEVAEFTESQYLFLMAQNRTSDASIRCYIRCTANPGGVGHAWVKKRFVDALEPGRVHFFKRVGDDDMECGSDDPDSVSRSFIPATLFDNPSLVENDPGYVRRLKQLPEAEQKAFIHGDWNVFQGQFFKMWRASRHVKQLESKTEFRRFIALDYGYGAPSAVGWFWCDLNGHLHCYRELYKEGLTYEKLAHLILENTPQNERIDYLVADPAIWGDKSRHSESLKGESGAETIQRIFGNFCSVVKADNTRVTGWGRLRIMLDRDEISFNPSCKNCIRTIPAMVHDELKVEDLNTEGEDHCSDMVRYAAMSRPEKTEPEPEKMKEWSEEYFEWREEKEEEDAA